MKAEEREKLEEVRGLLNDLQTDFLHTYKRIHEIIESLELEDSMTEQEDDEEEEMDEELMSHMDEIFGEED